MKKLLRSITRHSLVVTFFSVGALLFFSTSASGYAALFIPKIYDVQGDLDVRMNYEQNANLSSTGGSRSSNTTLEETLRLHAAGYVYHPRFIYFQSYFGGGLRQVNFESSSEPGNWRSGETYEYGLRVRVLPKHPYNLELYFERRSPIITGWTVSNVQPVYYDRGFIFRYKKRYTSVMLSLIENISDFGNYQVRSATRAADGTYGIGPLVNAAGHRITESEASHTRVKITQVYSFFENTLAYKGSSFTSHLDAQKYIEQNPQLSSSYTTEKLTWREQGNVVLPWNFQAGAGYGFEEENILRKTTSDSVEAVTNRTLENKAFSISHRLYNSLTTSYGYNNVSGRSTNGSYDIRTEVLAGSYQKNIPRGRLIAGVFIQDYITDIENTPTIEEIHPGVPIGLPVPDAGFFYLQRPYADVNSILVWVRSKLAPFELVLLTLNVDYFVSSDGINVRIDFPNPPLGFPPDTFEFLVQYSFASLMVKYKTNGLGYNLKVNLYDKRVTFTPYYSFAKQDQEVLSGSLPGGPQHTITRIIGFIIFKQPFTFTEEYQSIVSDVNPSRTIQSTIDYRQSIAPTTTVNGKLYYRTISRHGTADYEENTIGMNAQIQKNIPRNKLQMSLGLTYIHSETFAVTDSYSLISSMVWRIGTLLLTASASASESVTNSRGAKNTNLHEQLFVTISRKIF